VINQLKALRTSARSPCLADVCLDSARFLLQNAGERISGVLLESPKTSVPLVRSGMPVVMCLPHGVMQTVTIDLPLWLTPVQRWTELSGRATAALAPSPDGLRWVLDAYALASNADGQSWQVGAIAQSTVDRAWVRLQGFAQALDMDSPGVMCGGWSVVGLAVLPRDTSASAIDGSLEGVLDAGIRVSKYTAPWWHVNCETTVSDEPEAAYPRMNFLPYRATARAAYRRQSLVALVIYAVALGLGGGGLILNRFEAAAARDVILAATALRAAAQARDAQAQDLLAHKQRVAARERADQRLESLWRARAIDAVLKAPADTITYHQIKSTVEGIKVSGVAAHLTAVSTLLNRLGRQLTGDTLARVLHLAALPSDGIPSVRFEINLKPRVSAGTVNGS
jgi:Tfp pilus assembly protein PilN